MSDPSLPAAAERATHGIRVNAVFPGFMDTGMIDAGHEEIALRVPLGRRLATPEEIATTVLFLASDEARYVTGASWWWTVRLPRRNGSRHSGPPLGPRNLDLSPATTE